MRDEPPHGGAKHRIWIGIDEQAMRFLNDCAQHRVSECGETFNVATNVQRGHGLAKALETQNVFADQYHRWRAGERSRNDSAGGHAVVGVRGRLEHSSDSRLDKSARGEQIFNNYCIDYPRPCQRRRRRLFCGTSNTSNAALCDSTAAPRVYEPSGSIMPLVNA